MSCIYRREEAKNNPRALKKELKKKPGGIAVWIETFRVRTYMLFRGAVLVAEQARQTYADGETSVRRLP